MAELRATITPDAHHKLQMLRAITQLKNDELIEKLIQHHYDDLQDRPVDGGDAA